MADNILKKQLECINEDFLRGVFGQVGKPMWRALAHMFGAVTTGRSTLVSDIARTLRADNSRAEAKRAEEKVSGWLGRWDFAGPMNPWLLGKASACASDGETYAVDFSDISKEFGGEGMEGMAMGWDGSRGVAAMGHDFICISLVGAAHLEARPVYAKLAKGRKSKDALHKEAQESVMAATGGKGWFAVRWGDWKGLVKKATEAGAKMELFNLREDPRESTDVAADHPEVVAKLWSFIEAGHSDLPAASPDRFKLAVPAH